MPKIVDHEQRRRETYDAALRLAARSGLSAVSLRGVAAEMGVSLGTVQHYVSGIEELQARTFDRIGERRSQRVQAQVAALPQPASPLVVLRASALTGLPLDEPRREESLAEIAFLGNWIGGTVRARQGIDQLLTLFADLLRAAVAAGEAGPEIDPVLEARTLWAIVASQGVDLALGTATQDEVMAVVDHWFARIAAARVTPGRAPAP